MMNYHEHQENDNYLPSHQVHDNANNYEYDQFTQEGMNMQQYENFNSFNDRQSNFSEQYSPIEKNSQMMTGGNGVYDNNKDGLYRMGNRQNAENSMLNMNPMQTQDDSRVYQQFNGVQNSTIASNQTHQAMKGTYKQLSPQSSQKQFDQNNTGIHQSMISSNTPSRQRASANKRDSVDRSNSASRQGQQSRYNNQNLIASPYSPSSAMTQNPRQLENFQHLAPGIDDNQSALYKDYDKCGRTQNAFMQRAAFAGIKNLHTASFRNSSPLRMVQSRFPEKYEQNVAGSFNNTSQIDNEINHANNDIIGNGDRDLTSQQIIQNMFQYVQQEQDNEEGLENQQDQTQVQMINETDAMFMIEAGFQTVSETILSTIGSIQQWQQLSIEDKLLQFASFLSNMRKDLRLGGVIGVYLIFKSNMMSIGEEIKRVIIEELFTTLSEYETQEDVFMLCALEVIGLIGPNERSLSRIGIIKGLLCEPTLKRFQLSCFCTLIQLGFEGLQAIIELASKDYNSLQSFLLQNLLQVRAIQRIILVPSILTQLNMSENVKKQECIALLNRMGTLVWESGGLPIILELLEEGVVDRQLLASVLRTSGDEGEELLLKIIRYHKNYKVRMAAASVISYRLPVNPRQLDVDLRLDANDVVQLNAIPPGQICRYGGPISSVIQDEQNKNESEIIFQDQPFVEINSRDFLASLQRMMAMSNEYFYQQFDNDEERNSLSLLKEVRYLSKLNYQNFNSELIQDPTLFASFQYQQPYYYFNQTQNSQERRQISENVIKTLSQQLLKEEKAQVREVIAAAIGTIGLPEGENCVDALIRIISIQDEDPNVKAMCVWSIGRLATQQTGQKAKKILVAALKDSYWKVRAAACTAVAQIGEPVAQCTIPILTKLLREGQVNRQTVAETMINVGTLGEQTLVQILKNEPENNHKLRECIVRALALANVNNPNIDFVIEVLYQTSKDKHATVRKSSLLSLDILHKKTVNDSVTYLKARHLLPFFYRCLSDKDKQVRNCALLCIQNFGPQGELMFIEGLTKDKNYQIRCECANGLAQIGPSTFRTLLLSLHDQNPAVRDSASQAIIRHMTPESIDDAFKGKDHQRQTIKCAIREVLCNNLILNNDIKNFLQRVLMIFDESNLMLYNNGQMAQTNTGGYFSNTQQQLQSTTYYQSGNKENRNGQQWITDKHSYHQIRKSPFGSNQKANIGSSGTVNINLNNNMMLFNNQRGSASKSRQDKGVFQNYTEGYNNMPYSKYL